MRASYLENIEAEVGPDRLRRFFSKIDSKYRIIKSVRDLCIFARQNIVSDPPFSNLDLVSCRNVLIYLDGTLQKRAMSVLHYALKPSGFLVLGNAETGTITNLFETSEAKEKIFKKQKRTAPHPGTGMTPILPSPEKGEPPAERATYAPTGHPGRDFQKEADRILLSMSSPAGVTIDDEPEHPPVPWSDGTLPETPVRPCELEPDESSPGRG